MPQLLVKLVLPSRGMHTWKIRVYLKFWFTRIVGIQIYCYLGISVAVNLNFGKDWCAGEPECPHSPPWVPSRLAHRRKPHRRHTASCHCQPTHTPQAPHSPPQAPPLCCLPLPPQGRLHPPAPALATASHTATLPPTAATRLPSPPTPALTAVSRGHPVIHPLVVVTDNTGLKAFPPTVQSDLFFF